jgi:hypothetical protein
MEKQDSADPRVDSPGLEASDSPFPPPGRKYPGDGLAGHGIPLILDLKTDANSKRRKVRKKKKVAEKRARHEKFMTPERKEEEKKYRAFLAAELKKVSTDGPSTLQQTLSLPNITESPRDRFEYEEGMLVSDDEEMDKARDHGEQFKQLHITLRHAIITEIEEDVEDLVKNYFPADSKNFASRTLLHITDSYIEAVADEKKRLVDYNDHDALLPKRKDIDGATKFLKANDLPLSLISTYDLNQD